MTKRELKDIIKECLYESCIIDESFKTEKYIYNKHQVEIPSDMKKEMDKCSTIVCKFINKMQSTKEYKDIISKLIENGVLDSSCKSKKLYSDARYEIEDCNMKDGEITSIRATIVIQADWMTQDAFYYKYDGKKILGNFTDEYFKKLKQVKEITSCKYFSHFYNGDDFWGWDIEFEK